MPKDYFVEKWTKVRTDQRGYFIRTTLIYALLMLTVTEGMDLLGFREEPYLFDTVRFGRRVLLSLLSGLVVSCILWWSNERTFARRTKGK